MFFYQTIGVLCNKKHTISVSTKLVMIRSRKVLCLMRRVLKTFASLLTRIQFEHSNFAILTAPTPSNKICGFNSNLFCKSKLCRGAADDQQTLAQIRCLILCVCCLSSAKTETNFVRPNLLCVYWNTFHIIGKTFWGQNPQSTHQFCFTSFRLPKIVDSRSILQQQHMRQNQFDTPWRDNTSGQNMILEIDSVFVC